MLLHHQNSQLGITTLQLSGLNHTQCPIKNRTFEKLKSSMQEKSIKVKVLEDECINHCIAKSLLEKATR